MLRGIRFLMTNEQTVDAWVDAITAHNHGNKGAWTARFELDGAQLVERAVKRLEAIGMTMTPNGGPLEYIVSFPSLSAREVSTILVSEGAWLCPDQTRAPLP